MPKITKKEAKVIESIKALPAQERAKVQRAMKTLGRRGHSVAASLEAGQDIVTAYSRIAAKRISDTRTDQARRVLIGARVPRPMAQECRAAAETQGISLYAWVMTALVQALQGESGQDAPSG